MEENVRHIVSYKNETVYFPGLNNNTMRYAVTPSSQLITYQGEHARWTKKFANLTTCVKEACKRWVKHSKQREPTPDLSPCAHVKVFQKPCTSVTLHPPLPKPYVPLVIWSNGCRQVVGGLDALFFLDPVSYENVRVCAMRNPQLTILGVYAMPYIYVTNGFVDKKDSWQIRNIQLQQAVESVGSEFFRMQPTIECESEEEVAMHRAHYARAHIYDLEVRATQAAFGRES